MTLPYLKTTLALLLRNREALGKVMARGHSRIPVYEGNPRNLIGVLLVMEVRRPQSTKATCCYAFFQDL